LTKIKMKSILPVIALGLAASTAFAQLTINTPSSAVECEPLLLMWAGGTPPYFVSVFPGNQAGAAALLNFPQTSATSLSWTVNQPAQTALDLTVRDSTGATAQSAPFTVTAGPSTSCSTTTTFTFGSTAASAPTSAGSSGSNPATTTAGSSSSGHEGAGTSTGSSHSSTASASTKSAGASRVTGQFAAAGFIGAALVALLG